MYIRCGVVANIIVSHTIARGSIPRIGIFFPPRTINFIYPLTYDVTTTMCENRFMASIDNSIIYPFCYYHTEFE